MTSFALAHLDSRRFCLIYVKVLDYQTGKMKIRCHHGIARVEEGRLFLIETGGQILPVPDSAHSNIFPSDGTAYLRDAEYFVMVKLADNMEF